jgi:hypothetical protein
MYNSPETGQDSLEFIEIYNNGIYPLDIGNYQIGYNSTYQTMSYGLEVDPYKSIVLATDSVAFEGFYGFSPTLEWNATNQLDDNEAAIWIKDNNGILLDSVYYRDTLPWPNMAAGKLMEWKYGLVRDNQIQLVVIITILQLLILLQKFMILCIIVKCRVLCTIL